MDQYGENARAFFEEIGHVGFFKRLFGWGSVVARTEMAKADLRMALEQQNRTSSIITGYEGDARAKEETIKGLQGRIELVGQQTLAREKRISELEAEIKSKGNQIQDVLYKIGGLEMEIRTAKKELEEANMSLATFRAADASKIEDYQLKISGLNQLKQELNDDRVRLQNELVEAETKRMEEMRRTWLVHEENVQQTLTTLCKKHAIEYAGKESYPFKGKPDNAIKICGEYVIFDAKSPQSQDQSNFPDYLIAQAKQAEKYVGEDGVRKELFLVVPSNTVENIVPLSHELGSYRVYVISLDALEPIILTLKRIEDYEFAEQLSPEERDAICNSVGRLTHLTKRRMQVDAYFSEESMGALMQCKHLPEDIAKEVDRYEKAARLNPVQDRGKKKITDKDVASCKKSIVDSNNHVKDESTEVTIMDQETLKG
ncbi:MAG TPA: hypothetical protein VGK23_00855 [Methanomassiliicoccales archaeon]|jgi:hypothetical protein